MGMCATLAPVILQSRRKIIRGLAKLDSIRYVFHVRSACAMDRGSEQFWFGVCVVPVV
jgi:hypothetical protein